MAPISVVVTLYDMDGYLVANPLNRYVVGDRSNMKANPNGSLTIYIQSESPGAKKEANWPPPPYDAANSIIALNSFTVHFRQSVIAEGLCSARYLSMRSRG
jgi:hypothetical protein